MTYPWILLILLFLSLSSDSSYQRILCVGNSITLARPNESIGWHGLWGMAADQADQDWCHQLHSGLAAKQGFVPELAIISADVNRWETVEPVALFRDITVQEYDPDLVVVQMGDNSSPEPPYEFWRAIYAEARTWAPDARYIAIGLWGQKVGDVREDYIKRAANESGMEYIYIRDLHTPESVASQYEHDGVAWHPNSKGMKEIAGRILRQLRHPVLMPMVSGGSFGTVPGTVP